MLLILDNLEQLPDADTAVADLLNGAPAAKVLATSRRALLLPGEHVHPVPPLELPEAATLAEVERSGAVQLFIRQAQMVKPSFALTESNAAHTAEICRRLDGLPLALELAAARMRLLTPKALLDRLDAVLDIPAAGRTAPARQHTMRETIAWSYRLLDPGQQALFRHLAVFAGGADLDAVEAVCGTEAVESLAALVDASLVTVTETPDGEARIGMLATIHAFATELLTDQEDLDTVKTAHLWHYYVGVLDRGRRLFGPDYLTNRAWFATEHDNVRAALETAHTRRAEGLQDEDGRPILQRMAYYVGIGWFDQYQHNEAYSVLARCVDGALPDSADLVYCLSALAFLSAITGRDDDAREATRRAVEMARRLGQPGPLTEALRAQAQQQADHDDLDGAQASIEEAVRLAPASEFWESLCLSHQEYGLLLMRREKFEDAFHQLNLAAAIAEREGARLASLWARHNAACVSRHVGRPREALLALLALVPEVVALRGKVDPNLAEDVAACFASVGLPEQAAFLMGSADARHADGGTSRLPDQELDIGSAISLARNALGQDWERPYRAGQVMPLEDALLSVSLDNLSLRSSTDPLSAS